MSATHLKTAEYFADRARRSRHPEERDRFLQLAQNYREVAAGTRRETEPPTEFTNDTAIGSGALRGWSTRCWGR